ncbi:MAG: CBS domain-containing protein [Nitrososphaerales archaeon]
METNIITIDASKTVMDAINSMVKNNVWSLIVEKGGLPIGVVTERDIMRRCAIHQKDATRTTVEEIMSSPIITISPNALIGEAMNIMAEKNIRRVYVVEGGKIIGRITQTLIFNTLLNTLTTLAILPYQL